MSAGHFTTQNPSFTGGFVYVFSVYAKANGYRYMRLSFPSLAFAATGRAACFDLQTGTTGQTQTGGQIAGVTLQECLMPMYASKQEIP